MTYRGRASTAALAAGCVALFLMVYFLLPGVQIPSTLSPALCGIVGVGFLIVGLTLFTHPAWDRGPGTDHEMGREFERAEIARIKADDEFENEMKEGPRGLS